MCEDCQKLKDENRDLRERASMSQAEILRKKVLILKTELNQAKLINYWGQWLQADKEGMAELDGIAEKMRKALTQ